MHSGPDPTRDTAAGSIDFEPTDFAAAREALAEPPPGIRVDGARAPAATGPVETLAFEATDFEAARAVLDELPPGVEKLPTLAPGYWEQRRRKPLPGDRALAGTTIDWLLALPPSLRPRQLCERYPRVANALAEAWRDPPRRAALLDDLVSDSRGGRQGFPVAVKAEIEALRRV